jgi:hypothetical protein
MDLSPVEKALGHSFRSPELLLRELTHRSWAHENGTKEGSNSCEAENETLEFVGDSVVGLIVAEELFRRNPDTNEGGLSLMKHSLVRTETLGAAGERLKLGDHVRLSQRRKIGTKHGDSSGRVRSCGCSDLWMVATRHGFRNAARGRDSKCYPQSASITKTLLQETSANKMAATYQVVRRKGSRTRAFCRRDLGIGSFVGERPVDQGRRDMPQAALEMLNGTDDN